MLRIKYLFIQTENKINFSDQDGYAKVVNFIAKKITPFFKMKLIVKSFVFEIFVIFL